MSVTKPAPWSPCCLRRETSPLQLPPAGAGDISKTMKPPLESAAWLTWCHGGFVKSQHLLHQSVGVAYRFLQEGGSPPFDKVCWRSPQLIPSSASRSPRVFNHVQCFFVQSHAGWKNTFGNSEDL